MAQLVNPIQQKFLDANGDPLAGGKIYSYEAGTSTPKATFTDQSGAVANDNPIILDANGDATIWIDTGFYKFVIYDADDNLVRTIDNVSIFGEGTVTTDTLANGSVTTAKIADNAVTTAKILSNAVTTDKINAEAVTTAKIADSNVTTAKIADGNVTQVKLGAANYQISSSSGTPNTTSATPVDIPNLSVTITTTGRPVFIALTAANSSQSRMAVSVASETATAFIQIVRDSTTIQLAQFSVSFPASGASSANIILPLGAISHLDAPSAGTYTYKIQGYTSAGANLEVDNASLIVFEL